MAADTAVEAATLAPASRPERVGTVHAWQVAQLIEQHKATADGWLTKVNESPGFPNSLAAAEYSNALTRLEAMETFYRNYFRYPNE